jgi:translation initiation factor 3 subunit C
MNWDDDDVVEREEQKQSSNPFAASKGKYSYDESESSEEEKRVLKTPKEKLIALIKENYIKIKDHLEAKNYIGVLECYSEVMKNADKIKKEFGVTDKLPETFVRMLYLVEESLNLPKEEKSKLSQKNNTAFNSLKKETKLMKPFEEAVKTYREFKPSEEELREEEEEKELSDESLSDMSSVDYKDDNQDPAVRRLKWVKKPKEETDKKEKAKKTARTRPTGTKTDKFAEDIEEKEVVVQKLTVTEADIEKELNEIANQRGHLQRPVETVARIDHLLSITDNLVLKIKLLNLYILICFDTSPGQFSAVSLETWNKIHDSIITLFEYYHAITKLSETTVSVKEQLGSITGILQGSLVSILEKLEHELYKSLQFTDQNSSEYVLRIKDELKFLLLCSKIETFYTALNDQVSISKIYLLILLHIYYKNEESIKKMIERFNINVNRDEYLIKSCENPEKFMAQLSNSIYAHCDEKSKIRAMLCNIYFLCVHDRYNTAKDLIKRCHIYEVIQALKDDQLKVLYNRTLAKLGLCAFRNGKYADSLQYLHPLCQTGSSKLKEYLSQSYNKENEKSIFFDKEDKKRVIPYIMTINIDEVECTYYLASMILDLPNILLAKLGKRHKPFNNLFKKLLDNYEKQIFNGPPETIKELILCSTSSMTKGDWKKCSEMILSLKIYNHYKNREEIKNTINQHIKQTSLKCYLVLYSHQFSSFSLDSLTAKFALEKPYVRRGISAMILDGEIEAKWRGDILEITNSETNLKLIRQLEDNLQTITTQNLALLEAVSIKSTK